MRIRRTKPTLLAAEELETWRAIHEEEDPLASPFFHPAYTLAMAAELRGMEVAVFEEDDPIGGFFPYRRDR